MNIKKRTSKEWKGIIEDWKQNSLSQKEYCKKMNLNLYTFRDWKRKISPSSSKRRTSKEWKGIIEDWTNSSLTPKEYCKRHGLKVLSFNPWKRKLYFGLSTISGSLGRIFGSIR